MTKPIVEVVAKNIERYMKIRNMSRYKLEKQVGRESLKRLLERTTSNGCTIGKLEKIAEALDVKVIDLVEDWSEDEWNSIKIKKNTPN